MADCCFQAPIVEVMAPVRRQHRAPPSRLATIGATCSMATLALECMANAGVQPAAASDVYHMQVMEVT
jgi:hypothetical protein